MELGPGPTGAGADQGHIGSSQIMSLPAASTLGPLSALSLPLPDRAMIAPSQASAVTSASNAFEEVPDGFNFGPEFFGIESWSALSHGWADIGQFPGSGGIS